MTLCVRLLANSIAFVFFNHSDFEHISRNSNPNNDCHLQYTYLFVDTLEGLINSVDFTEFYNILQEAEISEAQVASIISRIEQLEVG